MTTEHDWRKRTHAFTTEADWLEERKRGIGASEIAAILGCSVYKDATPFRAWQQKTGNGGDLEETAPMHWGKRFEVPILDEYAERHLELAVKPAQHEITVHAEFPILRASRDALAYDINGQAHGVDAKFLNARARDKFGEPGSDAMPMDYVCQGIMSCEIFDMDRWVFPILWGDKRYDEYVVERSDEVAASLIAKLLDWWDTYVVRKQHPPLDGSDGATKFLTEMYPENVRPILLPVTDEALDLRESSALYRKAVTTAKECQTEADNALRLLVGDADGIEGVCTWKRNKPTSRLNKSGLIDALRALLVARGGDAAVSDIDKAYHDNTHTSPGPRVLRLKKGKA